MPKAGPEGSEGTEGYRALESRDERRNGCFWDEIFKLFKMFSPNILLK